MTFTISRADYSLLLNQNVPPQKYNLLLDDGEILTEHPVSLGQHGYTRSWELFPGISLNISNWRCNRDLSIETPVHEHSVGMKILNSGCIPIDDYPTIGGRRTCFSGSGMAPNHLAKFPHGENFSGIDIVIEPEVFSNFFQNLNRGSDFARRMIRQNDWAEILFPKVTPSIWALVRQIVSTPYQGTTRKLYLQAKVLELLAMQLDPIMAECDRIPIRTSLKPTSIDRIYQARDILATSLENPPSVLELAQQVGVSDRTLRRGFKEIFNDTVIGYYTSLRLEKAKQLLREGKFSLSEVASLVGYCNSSYFAAAFKRQFGITPSECKKGKLEKTDS